MLPPAQSEFWKDPAPQSDAAIVVTALTGELPGLPGLADLLVVVGEAVSTSSRHLQPLWGLTGALKNKLSLLRSGTLELQIPN